jgi:hypothetical protein
MICAWLSLAIIAAPFAAYTFAYQAATLYWGRRLVGSDKKRSTGLQDAITPRSQTTRNITTTLLLLATLVSGFVAFRWYSGIGAFLVVFFVSGAIKAALPKPDSLYFQNLIGRSLRERLAAYRRIGDKPREMAMSEVLRRFEEEAEGA